MRILGWQITKAAVPPTDLSAFDSRLNGRAWQVIGEPFAGAWQRNLEVYAPKNLLGFAAVWACVSIIASDISTLRIKLTRLTDGVWSEISSPAFSPVLRKPNRYQTRIQFIVYWLASKLLTGNTYILKERDNRGVVVALYVLAPDRVDVKVGTDGSVWYEIRRDDLSGVQQESMVVPASEIIHDRGFTPWHPLIGVSPLYAAGRATTQGLNIQENSDTFFRNASRPSLVISPKAPGHIDEAKAKLHKLAIEEATTGNNSGRTLLFSDEMVTAQMTMSAADAQLIEQLKWTSNEVAMAYHMPLYKLGIGQPTFNNISQLGQEYYDHCLREHIEGIEALLDDGLSLPADMQTEMDIGEIFRLDPIALAQWCEVLVRGGIAAPNEARQKVGLPPVKGGESPLMQQQNWTLEQLAERDAPADSPSVAPPSQQANPEPAPAEPPPNKAMAEPEYSEFELLGMAAKAAELIERARVGGSVA